MPKMVGGGSGRKDAADADGADSATDVPLVRFARNFRSARTKIGLTQHDIETHTGIKQAYISQIECGRQNPTLTTMATLARAVGEDVYTLLKPSKSTTRK
jgi:transcriptional regulator with XRE-family HTH domain